jgi:hypothetical protein
MTPSTYLLFYHYYFPGCAELLFQNPYYSTKLGILNNSFMHFSESYFFLIQSNHNLLLNFKSLSLEGAFLKLPPYCSNVSIETFLYNVAFIRRVYDQSLPNYKASLDLLADSTFYTKFIEGQHNILLMCNNSGMLFDSIEDQNINLLSYRLDPTYAGFSKFCEISKNSINPPSNLVDFLKLNHIKMLPEFSYAESLTLVSDSLQLII